VTEHVPALDPERFANCWCISGIVLDARRARAWRLPGFSSSALIEKDELTILRERSERGPQYVVTKMKPAVDAEKRQLPIDTGTRENGELESARVNRLLFEWGSFFLSSPEREEPLACGAVMAVSHRSAPSIRWRESDHER
jgi:hypothetical protein